MVKMMDVSKCPLKLESFLGVGNMGFGQLDCAQSGGAEENMFVFESD